MKPLPVSQDFVDDFESSIFLVYTNTQRDTSKIAASHDSQESEEVKLSIKAIAKEAYGAFCSENIPSIGKLMMDGWNQKEKKYQASFVRPK